MKRFATLALALFMALGAVVSAGAAPRAQAAAARKPQPAVHHTLDEAYLVLIASNYDDEFEGFIELIIDPDTITSRGFWADLLFEESDFRVRGTLRGNRVTLTGYEDGVRFYATLLLSRSGLTMAGTYRLSGAIGDYGTFTASTLLYVDDATAAAAGVKSKSAPQPQKRLRFPRRK